MTTRFLHFPSTGRSGGLGSFYILVLGSCLAGNHGHSPSPSRSRRAHPPRGTCLEAVPCVRSPGVCAQPSPKRVGSCIPSVQEPGHEASPCRQLPPGPEVSAAWPLAGQHAHWLCRHLPHHFLPPASSLPR